MTLVSVSMSANSLCDSDDHQKFRSVDAIRVSSARPVSVVHAGSSKFASFSTCRRKTEGRISRAVQISKIDRRDGLVLPRSIRLMKALSYPAFAASASWLIFCCVRRFRNNSPKATEGSIRELGFLEAATPHCGTASILRAAYNTFGDRPAWTLASNSFQRTKSGEEAKRVRRQPNTALTC
jgi:hypothetical protein